MNFNQKTSNSDAKIKISISNIYIIDINDIVHTYY